jgi:hypothetical protein
VCVPGCHADGLQHPHAYRSKDNYDQAIADYDQAITLNPELADTWAIGATLTSKRIPRKEIERLRHLIEDWQY